MDTQNHKYCKMIKIKNKIIPFPGMKAMTLWPFLFIRSKYITDTDIRHERIHGIQQKEMLVVALILCAILWVSGCKWWSLLVLPTYFYVYGILWLYKLVTGSKDAYKDNPMEQEAYTFQDDESYFSKRKLFGWLKF